MCSRCCTPSRKVRVPQHETYQEIVPSCARFPRGNPGLNVERLEEEIEGTEPAPENEGLSRGNSARKAR